MKVLVICSYGKNRSVFLKNYLTAHGYQAEAVGIRNEGVRELVDASDVIITVHPQILEEVQKLTDLSNKKVISLNVEDRPEEVLLEKTPLDGEAWTRFQEEHVYPKLIEQIQKYLPL